VVRRATELENQRRQLGRDRRQIGEAEQTADKLSRRAATARNDAERYGRELAGAAQRSGIADDGFGPVDPGDDLRVTARARVAAMQSESWEARVEQISELLEDTEVRA